MKKLTAKQPKRKRSLRAEKCPPGCDYKYAAQAKMHKDCGGDLKKFAKHCAETLKRIEKEYGFKFKFGVPKGWTPPKINWKNLAKAH